MEEKTKNRIKRNALKCHSKSLHYIQSRMSIGTHQSWRIAKRFSSWHNVWKSQKKVSYNSANEASYIYIWSGQKFIQNAKNGQFGEFLKTWCLRLNSVTRQVNFNWAKIGEKCDILDDFQTTWILKFYLTEIFNEF